MVPPNDRTFQILFVCTGNTCRSPMAEALLRNMLPPSLRELIHVVSAGTHADPGMPASAQAVLSAARKGIDLRGHRSQHLTTTLVRDSDLILVMEPAHVDSVLALMPSSHSRTHLLSNFGAEAGSAPEGIHDPMGGSPEIYEESLLRIQRQLERILPYLEERVVGERRS